VKGGRFYLWVLAAIVLGGLIGWQWPEFGVQLKPLGDGFIALIRMLIAPVIFLTVVLGIAGAGAAVGGARGRQALVYFEVVSTLALLIGLAVNLVAGGRG
jgi:aerobic C4-dicarboxylate transport protein